MGPLLDRVQDRRLMDVPQITEIITVLHVQTLLLIHFLRRSFTLIGRPRTTASTTKPGSYCSGGRGSVALTQTASPSSSST